MIMLKEHESEEFGETLEKEYINNGSFKQAGT